MTANPELPSDNGDQQSTNEALYAQFDALLRNTAEDLEIYCPTDETIFTTEDAVFGRFSDGSMTISHTVTKSKRPRDKGSVNKHSGFISYTSADDEEKNLTVDHEPRYGQLWQVCENGDFLFGRGVLQKLDREWPIADDDAPKDAIRKLVNVQKDANGDMPDVAAEDLMEILENYTLRRDTGKHSYEMKWNYRDLNAGTVNGRMHEQAVTLSIICDQKDSLRQVDMSTTMTLPGVTAPVTYYVHSDELGDVTVTAGILNIVTNRKEPYYVENLEDVFATSKRILQKLINDKTPRV